MKANKLYKIKSDKIEEMDLTGLKLKDKFNLINTPKTFSNKENIKLDL